MRLIDADELLKHLECEIDDNESRSDGVLVSISHMEDMPTVKAIPIDVIMDFCHKRYFREDRVTKNKDMMDLEFCIQQWRMENDPEYRRAVNKWWEEHSSRFD